MSVWDWLENTTAEAWGEFEAHTGISPNPLHSYIVQVSAGVWRCSWPDDAMLAYLKSQECKYVVNLCAERQEDKTVAEHGMIPIYYPEIDGTAVHMEQVDRYLEVVGMGKTAVHCREGHGRTGQYIAALRVLKQGWTNAAALIEARSYGHLEPDQVRFILNLSLGKT